MFDHELLWGVAEIRLFGIRPVGAPTCRRVMAPDGGGWKWNRWARGVGRRPAPESGPAGASRSAGGCGGTSAAVARAAEDSRGGGSGGCPVAVIARGQRSGHDLAVVSWIGSCHRPWLDCNHDLSGWLSPDWDGSIMRRPPLISRQRWWEREIEGSHAGGAPKLWTKPVFTGSLYALCVAGCPEIETVSDRSYGGLLAGSRLFRVVCGGKLYYVCDTSSG